MKTGWFINVILGFFILTLVVVSCKKEKAISSQSCSLVNRSFVNDIAPILQTNCAIIQCHIAGGLGAFDATDYNSVAAFAEDGSIMRSIKHEGVLPMPRINPLLPNTTKLADSLIREIECWILQGYPNN